MMSRGVEARLRDFLWTSVYVIKPVGDGMWGTAAAGAEAADMWRVSGFLELSCRAPMNSAEEILGVPVMMISIGCSEEELEERASVWRRIEGWHDASSAVMSVMNMRLLSSCVPGFERAFARLFGDASISLSVRDVPGLRLRYGSREFSLSVMRPAVVVVIDEHIVVGAACIAYRQTEVVTSEEVQVRWVLGQRVFRMTTGSRLVIRPPFVMATFVFVFDERGGDG
jgi:hypothetical protein